MCNCVAGLITILFALSHFNSFTFFRQSCKIKYNHIAKQAFFFSLSNEKYPEGSKSLIKDVAPVNHKEVHHVC